MKRCIYSIFCLALVAAVACVDDYTDANPPRRLDAPTFRVDATETNEVIVATPVNRFQNTYEAYASYEGQSKYKVSVIDAPGGIGTVSVTGSVPDFGTVAVDEAGVAAIQGKTSGDFTFTFTPNPALGDEADRSMNLVISVSDQQTLEGEANPKTTTMTLPLRIVRCISTGMQEGLYRVTSATGNLDGGVPYTLEDLEADWGGPIEVEITNEFPGRYVIDEVTGGVWPTYYSGRAHPDLQVDLCGNSISGHPGAVTAGSPPGPLRTFSIDGILNGDGTITIEWSYVREDAPTPAVPAQGTYTLTKL